jgi:hypothetical protein
MTDWHAEGVKSIEILINSIHTHNENGTHPNAEGMIALEMMLNAIHKEVRSLEEHDKKIRDDVIDEVQSRLLEEQIEIGYHEPGDMWAPLKGINEAFDDLRGEQP